jgi:hypothetical protein
VGRERGVRCRARRSAAVSRVSGSHSVQICSVMAERDQICLVTIMCAIPLLICSAGTPPKRLLQQIELRRLEIVERYRRLGWLQRGHETTTTRLVPREEHCQNLLKRLRRCRRLGASELGYLL